MQAQDTANARVFVMMVIFWFVNAVVLGVTAQVFPSSVIFGNEFVPAWMSLSVVSLVLSVLCVALMPVFEKVAKQEHIKLKTAHWMVLYYVVNTILIWMLARLAGILGFGIVSWHVAILLGFVLDFAQGFAYNFVASKQQWLQQK
jgi:hypothetical protein